MFWVAFVVWGLDCPWDAVVQVLFGCVAAGDGFKWLERDLLLPPILTKL